MKKQSDDEKEELIHCGDKLQTDEEELILSQEFFCTQDYITPEGQNLPVELDSDIEDSIPCPGSPEKPKSVRNKRPWNDMLTSWDSPGFEQDKEQEEAVSLDSDEMDIENFLGKNSPKKHSYVPQSAIALRYRSMPPPCMMNPFLINTSIIAIKTFPIKQSKWAGYCQSTSGRSGLSRYMTDFHEVKQIGSGNFGCVFKVLSRLDGCLYAVKKSTKSERAVTEVQTLATLGFHEHIVGYHTSWTESGQLYIQMELCDHDLSNISSSKSYNELEVLHILHQIAKALEFVHEKRIAHLDVKPSNIFVKDGIYKLGDFGCATFSEKNLSVEEGDARYMAHEILNENYDHLDKADIYSLGVTIYELVTETTLLSINLCEGKFPPIHGYTAQFQNLLKAMVDRDPVKRPSAKEVVAFHSFNEG